VNISECITDDFFAVSTCKGYALIDIEAIVQRPIAALTDRDEAEKTLAVTSQLCPGALAIG
jgi:hypothetical protein